MEKQSTAVSWLKPRLQHISTLILPQQFVLFEQFFDKALEMEREQIIKAHQRGMDDSFVNPDTDSEQYFTDTYKQP